MPQYKMVDGVRIEMTPEEELEFEMMRAELQAVLNAAAWKRNRQKQYGAIGDQLDMLYRDIKNGTLDQTGELFTHIDTVKTNNPKPGS